jgi:hypothetical protein
LRIGGTRIGHWLDPVSKALDDARSPVDLFFRDDDVGWDDRGLWALLDLVSEHSLPLDLAVIPCALGDALARSLQARVDSSATRVAVHQHGYAHVNHEPTGRKYEFGPSRSASLQSRDIAEGRRRLQYHLGPLVEPIFTPPWNRCTPATGRCLVELGFSVLSREARSPRFDIPGLIEIPIHIDWFAHRKRVRLSRTEFGEMLASAMKVPGPVGIMFHHAVMDAEERSAAGELLTLIADHHRARPHSMLTLVAIAQQRTAATAR